jgi:hypothetical protein
VILEQANFFKKYHVSFDGLQETFEVRPHQFDKKGMSNAIRVIYKQQPEWDTSPNVFEGVSCASAGLAPGVFDNRLRCT